MKYIIILFSSFLLSGCNNCIVSCIWENEEIPTGLKAYLVLYRGNQTHIADSTLIYDKQAIFKTYLSDYYIARIITPANMASPILFLSPSDKVSIKITDNSIEGVEINGGNDAGGFTELLHMRSLYASEIQKIKTQMRNTSASNESYHILADSLAHLIKMRMEHVLSVISSTSNPLFAFMLFKTNEMESIVKDSMYQILKLKFPKDKDIQTYPQEIFEPASEASIKTANYLKKIQNVLITTESNIAQSYDKNISPYKIEDKVADFSLLGRNNKEVSLSSCNSQYILIDFWATWCGPCRNEIPHIVATKKKYGKELDVFAVSLDYYSDRWKQYIEENDLNDFTHVLLLNNNPLKPEILARFGCSAIPRNFLLDKDRRIIAIDLRGEALEQKMKELVGSE